MEENSAIRGQQKCGSDETRMKRVVANRNSARASYQRRKYRFAVLQSRTIDLHRTNHVLMAENNKLLLEVQELRQQCNALRSSRYPHAREIGNAPTTDLDIAGLVAHPQRSRRFSSFFSNEIYRGHYHHCLVDSVPMTDPSLNQTGCYNYQKEEQDVSMPELQKAFLTEQFLEPSLGLPSPGGIFDT